MSSIACHRAKAPLRLLTFPESYGYHLGVGLGLFRDVRLEVQPEYQQTFPRMLEALLAREGDVATVNFDSLVPLVAQGRKLKAFCCLANRPGTLLVASPARRSVRTVEDLRGVNVGVPGPGSSSHQYLKAILRVHGVPQESVGISGIGVAAGAIAAVENGAVDAAMLTNLGYNSVVRRNPSTLVLADLRQPEVSKRYLGSQEYPTLCLVANSDWLASDPQAASTLARAFVKANQWMAQRTPAQIRAALPPEARAKDPAADEAAIAGMLPSLNLSGRLERESANAAWTLMASIGAHAPQRMDEAFTNDLL